MDAHLAGELCSLGADRRDLLEHRHRIVRQDPAKASILLACMPKSGSTFLSRVLAEATGFARQEFVYDINGHNGWDLYLPKLLTAQMQMLTTPFVAQHHILATPPNLELIKLFNFRTVVLVRNIFDVVVSLRDHCLTVRSNPLVVGKQPAYVPHDFDQFDDRLQLDWTIDYTLPWYIRFYVGWSKVLASQVIDCRLASYDDLLSDQTRQIGRLLAGLGVPRPHYDVESAIQVATSDGPAIRLNKGVSGRGAELLSRQQQEKIIDFTRYYPTIDFTPIGL